MDTLIRGCRIIDGTGSDAYVGSVGIEQGKLRIFSGTDAPMAGEVIDGTGLTAVPGFIDAHSHGDLMLRGTYGAKSKLSQGITTQVAGQCGVSMFPQKPGGGAEFRRFVSGIAPSAELPDNGEGFPDGGAFFRWLHTLPQPVNTYSFVGHGALRIWAMGYANRRPDETELHRMQQMLRKCIRQGALGLSTGLVYAPSCYADNEELSALLTVVREEGGIYACHPRNEADTCVEARREALNLAEKAGVPLCVSHLKAAGRDNWGKPKAMLREIDRALERGQRVLIDTYPYLAGCTSLNVSIPPRYFDQGMPGLVKALQSPVERAAIRAEMSGKSGYENYVYNSGGWDGVFIGSCPVNRDGEGLFLSDYAAKLGKDPYDAYFDLLIENGGLGLGVYFHMSEDDVTEILSHPFCAVGTDGLLGSPEENPHPRTFGAMPRAYRLMVREKKLLSEERMIHKMTGLPAQWLGLAGKGLLRDGYDGDVLLLDMERFADTATYARGSSPAEGIRRVWVAGKTVWTGEDEQ